MRKTMLLIVVLIGAGVARSTSRTNATATYTLNVKTCNPACKR